MNAATRTRPPLTVAAPALLEDGSDATFRGLVHNLLGFLARHEAIRDGHAAAIGLAGPQYTALISIAHLAAAGDVSVRSLAEHLHLSGAFVTSVTNRLLALGLIDKASDPADRRRLRLSVTAAGRALLAELAPMQRAVNDAEFAGLTAAEFRQLAHTVEKLLDSSERALALQSYLAAAALPGLASAKLPRLSTSVIPGLDPGIDPDHHLRPARDARIKSARDG